MHADVLLVERKAGGIDMRRREFIALAGGAAAGPLAWPLSARAQQRAVPVIGFLMGVSADGFAERVRFFRQGLKETGYVEGENVAIEYRWAENQLDRLPAMAADLVRRQVAVIAASGGRVPVQASKAATKTIPIVFAVGADPVGLGLVASLGHPGGNATGIHFFSAELVAKRLEILRELLPKSKKVAVLVNPANADNSATTVRDALTAARAMGLQVKVVNASTSGELHAAFASLARERPDALLVGNEAFFQVRRVQLANLVARHAMPASFSTRESVEAGGLMSYGTSISDAFRLMGVYAGRVLKGAKPADLPVLQSTKFELVINAQTARMLGLTVPPSLLARADEVIE